MKLTRLTLILLIGLVFASATDGFSKTFDELMRLATQETLPEVRKAAGLALMPALADSGLSDDELLQLVEAGASPELQGAAAGALGVRQAEAAADIDALLAVIENAPFPETADAAARVLADVLLQEPPGLDTLIAVASSEVEAARWAAVAALAAAWAAGHLSNPQLQAQAADGQTDALRQAAASALLNRLASSVLITLTDEALLALGAGGLIALESQASGANAELQAAAGTALQVQLAQSEVALDALIDLAGDEARTPALRASAGEVLSQRLLGANLPLADLEALAAGPTSELRAATRAALVQATVGALGRLELTLTELVDSVGAAASLEQAVARAEAVLVLLRTTLVTLAAQADVEALANGETILVAGQTLDGSLDAYRIVAGEFLIGVYSFFGFIDRFGDPLEDLLAIAENASFSPELRAGAAGALEIVMRAQRSGGLNTLKALDTLIEAALALAGQGEVEAALARLGEFRSLLNGERPGLILTAEVGGDFTARQVLNDEVNRSVSALEAALPQGRLLTVRSEVNNIQRALQSVSSSIERAPEVTPEALIEWASTGATPEVQQAASVALAARLLQEGADLDPLLALARSTESEPLQQAVIPALAAAWIEAGVNADTLYRHALTEETAALRAAAAWAWADVAGINAWALNDLEVFADGGTVLLDELSVDGSAPAVRQAAGQRLDGFFEKNFDTVALIALAASDPSLPLRESAARALRDRLIADETSESDLFALISQNTLLFGPRAGASESLSCALAGALAVRFLD